MTITRYEMVLGYYDRHQMAEQDDGDYVLHADALALVAAAYHDAGGVMDTYLGNARIGHSSVVRALEELAGWLRDNILAKTPADAQTALTAIEQAAYERGVRDAAAQVADTCPHADVPGGNCTPDTFDEGTSAAYEAILALLTQEGR